LHIIVQYPPPAPVPLLPTILRNSNIFSPRPGSPDCYCNKILAISCKRVKPLGAGSCCPDVGRCLLGVNIIIITAAIPPPALHHPANHPQTNNSAHTPSRSQKRREKKDAHAPHPTSITDNTSTRVLKPYMKSRQLTLPNLSPRHQNYTTPPHHRELPPGAATPPIPAIHLSLPTRCFRNNGGLGLSGLGVLARPPPPPLIASRCRWTAARGQPPHTWHDDLCGFLKLCFNAVWTG